MGFRNAHAPASKYALGTKACRLYTHLGLKPQALHALGRCYFLFFDYINISANAISLASTKDIIKRSSAVSVVLIAPC